jgi:hypothetical protein
MFSFDVDKLRCHQRRCDGHHDDDALSLDAAAMRSMADRSNDWVPRASRTVSAPPSLSSRVTHRAAVLSPREVPRGVVLVHAVLPRERR